MPLHLQNPEILAVFLQNCNANNLFVVSDFDRTLTYGSVDGVKTPSLISLLYNGAYLSPDYREKAQKLFETYHPFEKDTSLPFAFRKEKMDEWWETHNTLLVASGLHQDDLRSITKHNLHLRLRDGIADFLKLLSEKDIPVIIFSASGAGDAIKYFLEFHEVLFPNIHFIANLFEWDEQGFATKTSGALIHPLSKNTVSLSLYPKISRSLADRDYLLLLWDSLSDISMSEVFEYEDILKIGFFNEAYNHDQLEHYQQAFDVLQTWDSDAQFLGEIFWEMK